MNVSSLQIPYSCAEMIKTYEDYYHTFYLEMVRMSNSNFNTYIQNYIELIRKLVKSNLKADTVRGAIGILSLHVFGYDDFNHIIHLFDRLLPQTEVELVKFTSWCSGILTHHPGIAQSHYVSHLFERLIGWASSRGRRARPLAAAHMINSLALSAGSSVVVFFPSFQTIIWLLVSHESTTVLKATADAVYNFAMAILRYSQSYFNDYLAFISVVATKLISFGDPIRVYAALLLFKQLINCSPEYFVSKFLILYSTIDDAALEQPLLVQQSALSVIACLSQVDPVRFQNEFANEVFFRIDELIIEFPTETVEALCLLIQTIPKYMKKRIEELKVFGERLVSIEQSPFLLFSEIFKRFKEAVLPLKEEIITSLIDFPINDDYYQFIIISCEILKSERFGAQLSNRLKKELKCDKSLLALKILADVSPDVLTDLPDILHAIESITSSQNQPTREAAPKAMYNIARRCSNVPHEELVDKFFHIALYDNSLDVRAAALNVLNDNVDKSFASPQNMKFFQVFVNDDAVTVRQIALRILEKLVPYNPIGVASITRNTLLDAFFIIRHVPGIRQRSRAARILPDLIRTSAKTITVYSDGFMDIAMTIFKNHQANSQTFSNFIEVNSYMRLLISIVDSLTLLAPLDPPIVAKHADYLIEFLCNMLEPEANRELILSILELLYILLIAPASTILYRAKAPLILSSCSSLLSSTDSRKERIALLKVVGALGVIEVHQKPTTYACSSPPNIEEDLVRQFFHPSRDDEGSVDESWLIQETLTDQYETVFAASSVMDIFKDNSLKEFHIEAVQALVSILALPNMSMLMQFDMFATRFLEVLKSCSNNRMKIYLPLFAKLVRNSTSNIAPFVKHGLDLINERFCPELADEFITVILAFLDAIKDSFSPYASETICLLIGCLDNSKTTDVALSRNVLNAFSSLGIYASDLLYLIVPQICDAVECEQTLPKVRVAAFQTLSTLMRSVDLFPYLGPIMRALSYGIFYDDGKTSRAAFEFLYVTLKTQGRSFLKSAEPIISMINSCGKQTKELAEILSDMKKEGVYPNHYTPFQTPKKPYKKPVRGQGQDIVFAEDAILNKAMTPNLGREKHLEQWLLSFMLTVVANSPSPSIRACTTLATNYAPLAGKLFCTAFLSCWRLLSDKAKEQITRCFSDLLTAAGTYDTVIHEIIKLLFFMDKIEMPLDIDIDRLLQSSIRYGGAAFALHLVHQGYDKDPDNFKQLSMIIDLYAQLGSWPNAAGMWKKAQLKYSSLNKIDVLMKLRMWDQVEPAYRDRFTKVKNFVSFVGLAQSMAALAMWEEIMEFYETFKGLERHQKNQVAAYFAEAAMKLGSWDALNSILQFAPADSLICKILAALNALHDKRFEKAELFVEEGFSLLASRPIAFLADNQQVHHETMLQCQELVEISEMKLWIQNKHRNEVEEVWNERLKTAPRDFDLWFGILSNRAAFTQIRDTNLIKFFSMKSATLGTKLHTNAFESLFPAFDFQNAPDVVKVCNVVAHWNTGEKSRALEEMAKLLTLDISSDLLDECRYIFANWTMEHGDSVETIKTAYENLKLVIESPQMNLKDKNINDSNMRMRRHTSETLHGFILPVSIFRELTSKSLINVDTIRKWCDINVALANLDKANLILYVTNAIDGLTKCATMAPSFPDIVLLLNIFFENADKSDVFSSTAHKCIETLPPKLLIQASPQLLVQLSHATKSVADFVHEIVIQLLEKHFHELIFSIIVLTKSDNLNRSMAAHQILDEFTSSHPREYIEVVLIRKCLLRAAVTYSENMLSLIADSADYFKHNKLEKMRAKLENIIDMNRPERAKCPMHRQFQKCHGEEISKLQGILADYSPTNTKCIQEISEWCKKNQDELNDELKNIHTIQMAAISPELCKRTHFYLAVFGTYKPNKPVVRIQYFVGQFSVYMTKQQPKDVVVKGEDGKFYQYLLKGHEDLRLDERIMQFFRLINSLMNKETCFNGNIIQTIAVIPLSLSHGLVQWVPGTETLRNIVEDYRRLHHVEPVIEYEMANTMSVTNYDYLQPIHKMQILESVFKEIPDTDIANSFWLKAASAEMWFKKTNSFAISTAITSIVGYIIGLGDRHPSNLLINRDSGKVVHIDFGDCFERAMLRRLLPEVVPFRLTRMMVRAMGAAGVDGIYRSSFVDMSSLLRENARVLVMVLSVFVHEPLSAPDEAGTSLGPASLEFKEMKPKDRIASSVEMRKRVTQKLTGSDFESEKPMSVEEQASKLIQMSTNVYNLSRMYSGWCPFW